MADIMDCGEIGNVHPSDKKTPGLRLAALALKFVYGLIIDIRNIFVIYF